MTEIWNPCSIAVAQRYRYQNLRYCAIRKSKSHQEAKSLYVKSNGWSYAKAITANPRKFAVRIGNTKGIP
jgi:hypothetical protein